MKKTSIICILFLIPLCLFSAKKNTSGEKAKKVREIIAKVNDNWQSKHSPLVNSFWHNAVYHTGNMEAYFLTGNEKYREYSEAWANNNKWMGAQESDKSKWKYSYGETNQYVLFGDYQACFQTYIDLYNLDPSNKKISRALQVMDYQMKTGKNDYWWWCDALYMVMPVMSKLYKVTNNVAYLDKLYEYLQYSDDLMYDKESHLYFRDKKYIYPKEKTINNKKNFWARGNGWVFAALAKVLKDMPKDYKHYAFFVTKYKDMAQAIAESQCEQGYWSRSMLDPKHAEGPETSGTSLFTYGFLWGINNYYLDSEKYMPIVDKAWNYLENTALQKDGKIGYVQPIGERAIPNQKINSNSSADFGVGVFLLAACEYTRFLEKNTNADRKYWVDVLYKIAKPVLSNMAEGNLQKNMTVETSPTWDGRNIKVAYMETFGRLMAGISPWLNLPDESGEEGAKRKQLREWALKSYKNAVDPQSPDYLLWRKEGQTLVDAAYIAESFIRGYESLWLPLDETTKKRYIEEFTQLRRIDPPYTNWLLFSSVIESFMAKAGAPYDMYRVNSAIRKVEEWYTGDGWYSDGPVFAFDYYSSYVFHPMYLETLQNMKDAKARSRIDYTRYYDRAMKRCQKYGIVLERFISPEGTFPVFGRSIPYRLATMQPLALLSLYNQLPASLSKGQVRAALTAVIHRMFDYNDNFNEKGYLSIGFCGKQKGIADWYTNNGSLYMTSLCFLPLGLSQTDSFWSDAAQDWTCKKAWNNKDFPKDHQWKDTEVIRDRY